MSVSVIRKEIRKKYMGGLQGVFEYSITGKHVINLALVLILGHLIIHDLGDYTVKCSY